MLRDEVLALREEAKSLKGILNYLAAAWDSAYSYEEMGHPAEEAVRRYRELYADV